MKCSRCNSDYERMAGVQRFKRDYGYCSVACLIADKPPCPGCGAVVVPNGGERLATFVRRSYCTHRCAVVSLGKQSAAKGIIQNAWRQRDYTSEQTREKQRAAWRNQTPEQRTQRHYARIEGHKQWRQTSRGIRATTIDYARTMRERGRYQESSDRLTAFYQTPEGEEARQRIADSLRGKPRPPLVRQKLRAALIAFWDTPEGTVLRERLSEQRSGGLPDVPYGPGWARQAAKARARDGCCVLCQATRKTNGRILDVHHIHARRKFGYIPGQNSNYRFANHLANLVTLCQSCHMRVEMKGAALPPAYQSAADELWKIFVSS